MGVSGQLQALTTLNQGRAPSTHWLRGWVGLTASLGAPAPARKQTIIHFLISFLAVQVNFVFI